MNETNFLCYPFSTHDLSSIFQQGKKNKQTRLRGIPMHRKQRKIFLTINLKACGLFFSPLLFPKKTTTHLFHFVFPVCPLSSCVQQHKEEKAVSETHREKVMKTRNGIKNKENQNQKKQNLTFLFAIPCYLKEIQLLLYFHHCCLFF